MVMCRKGKKGYGIFLVLFFIFPVLLTGCWNNRDLTEMNFVAGMGLDRTEEGKVLMTVQVVEPAAIISEAKAQSAQPKPVIVKSYEGETIFEAIRGILSNVDKKLFFSTAQVLILGERLSQDDIEKILDFFQRDHEINYRMDILVAKDATPEEILEVESDQDPIEAMYIKGTVENTDARGTVKRTMLIDLIKDIGSSGKQLAIGQISKEGEKEVKTEGLAVFKDGKLAGWLGPYETRGYLLVINQIQSAIVNVTKDKDKVAMEIIKSKGRIDVAFRNSEPSKLIVKVEVQANVGEYEGRGKLESPGNLHNLEKILKEEIKKEIKMAMNKIQKEYSSDIFGFGEHMRKHQPQYWKKVKKDWNDTFSDLPVEIQVDARINRIGSVKDPVKKVE